MLLEPHNIAAWAKEHENSFVPPIMNKLMHKKQLSIMFVGGPNTRTDFHIEGGGELFLMIKGNMQLPTVQQGKRKLVDIREGQLFILPPRVPHSPQRPETGSLGLVIERERVEGEMDCLRWYRDFETCEEVLFERYFRCNDLGKDLVPVVQEFKASTECATGVPTESSTVRDPPLQQDFDIVVPDPINLMDFIRSVEAELLDGKEIDVMSHLKHQDKEFQVLLSGGTQELAPSARCETWLYQLKGPAVVKTGGRDVELTEGSCCVLGLGEEGCVVRHKGSVGMLVRQRPGGVG